MRDLLVFVVNTLIFLGIVCFIFLGIPHRRNELLRRRGVVVPGLCVRQMTSNDQKVSCRISYRVVPDGQERFFNTGFSHAAEADVGQSIEVRYDRKNPKRVDLAYFIVSDGSKLRQFLDRTAVVFALAVLTRVVLLFV